MGYLNNSTTNITLDAVLTDLGRQLLSNNNNSFIVTKFAFGDDDIDYSIIRKYGRVIGKEKVEKNTPILEALTSDTYAQKHKLMTLINPNHSRLPLLTLKLGATTAGGSVISLNTAIQGSDIAKLNFQQEIVGTFDSELVDSNYHVFINNRFLQLGGQRRPDFVDRFQVARYMISPDSKLKGATVGSSVTFALSLKNITNTLFTIFGKPLDKNTIVTYGTIRGVDTGIEKQFQVNIARTA